MQQHKFFKKQNGTASAKELVCNAIPIIKGFAVLKGRFVTNTFPYKGG